MQHHRREEEKAMAAQSDTDQTFLSKFGRHAVSRTQLKLADEIGSIRSANDRFSSFAVEPARLLAARAHSSPWCVGCCRCPLLA